MGLSQHNPVEVSNIPFYSGVILWMFQLSTYHFLMMGLGGLQKDAQQIYC